jgi:tetratricopeptide (TPR) repeat protein
MQSKKRTFLIFILFILNSFTLFAQEGEGGGRSIKPIFDQATRYYSQGQFEKAIAVYNEILKVKKDNFAVYDARAAAYTRLGKYKEALADYKKALQLSKEEAYTATYYFNCANIYYAAGNYQKAIDGFSQAIKENPKFTMAYLNMGIAQDGLKKYNLAQKAYEKVIVLDPKSVSGHLRLGRLHHTANRFDEALKYYSKVIQLNPKEKEVYLFKADINIQQNKLDLAIPEYDGYLKIVPTDAKVWAMKASAKAGLSRNEDCRLQPSSEVRC